MFILRLPAFLGFKKTQSTAPGPQAPSKIEASAAVASPQKSSKKIFLNGLDNDSDMDDNEITVLGSAMNTKSGVAMNQVLKNGNAMCVQADGSYVVRNPEGIIVKTADVLRVKREYRRDEESGELMVRRFGMWTKPEEAHLDEEGTLHFKNGDVEIEERLSGLHIQTNRITGVTIQTHHHNGFELVKLANGEIWKRETNSEKELFSIWKNGKLTFKSQTYFESIRSQAETPNGPQSMVYVSRTEQSWENGHLAREKFSFKNSNNDRKDATCTLQLGTGMLVLRNVASVVTKFENDEPTETIYELSQPLNLRVDVKGRQCNLTDIVRLRCFAASESAGLAFDAKDGNEYIVFLGQRSIANRGRAAEAVAHIERDLIEGSYEAADLVIR